MIKKLAFLFAVLGALAVLFLVVVGGAFFPNYSHASQFISELGANGAPYAHLVNFAGFLPAGVFICAFSYLAWMTLPHSKATTLGLLGVALYAFGYIVAAFFPCEAGCRPVQPSLSQAIHNLLGLVGYLTAPLTLVLLGWQARSWPRATHLFILGGVGGILTFLGLIFLTPEFAYVGVAQRVIEGSMLTWVVVCGGYINRHNAADA